VAPGSEVAEGHLLGVVHAKDEAGVREGTQVLRAAIRVGAAGEQASTARPLVFGRLGPGRAA
jgi:hypothetical protein